MASGTNVDEAIQSLEREAGDLEARLSKLRIHIAGLRELAGLPTGPVAVTITSPPPSGVAAPAPAPAAASAGSIPEEAFRLLQREGPMHVRDIVARLRERGVRLSADNENARRNLVGAMGRRGDLFTLLGRGRYTVAAGTKPPASPTARRARRRAEQDLSAPRGAVTGIVEDAVTRAPGINFGELADRVTPGLPTTSANPRKLVHSVMGYLVKHGRIRKAADGRLYPASESNGPAKAPQNDNGRMPELALDR